MEKTKRQDRKRYFTTESRRRAQDMQPIPQTQKIAKTRFCSQQTQESTLTVNLKLNQPEFAVETPTFRSCKSCARNRECFATKVRFSSVLSHLNRLELVVVGQFAVVTIFCVCVNHKCCLLFLLPVLALLRCSELAVYLFIHLQMEQEKCKTKTALSCCQKSSPRIVGASCGF